MAPTMLIQYLKRCPHCGPFPLVSENNDIIPIKLFKLRNSKNYPFIWQCRKKPQCIIIIITMLGPCICMLLPCFCDWWCYLSIAFILQVHKWWVLMFSMPQPSLFYHPHSSILFSSIIKYPIINFIFIFFLI